MFVGFLVTFLIQHVIGLDGMPRRVYEYDNVGHLALYNLISTVGSFILALGILVTIINVVRSLKHGAIAGPDPWKANTLEWFTTSPPPANNFDVIPLVRSAEPMKDIRVEIERRTQRRQRQAPPRSRPGPPRSGCRCRWRRPAEPRARIEAPLAELPAAGLAPRTRQLLRDYVELTKPKVQSLLLLTTIATMYVAGDPSPLLVALTCLGRLPVGRRRGRGEPLVRPRHRRAAWRAPPTRPIPAGRVSPRAALTFGCIARGAVVPGAVARRSTCSPRRLSFAGFLGYVFVYTVWLKRRTPQNIVIGGAAGAVPPLVGWAAVTGSVGGAAVILFFIVFFWTPPHFWALSLLMKDEYAEVGVPMLPVVRGEDETRRQILLYSVLLYAVTQLPFCAGGFGGLYLVASLAARPRLHRRRRAPLPPRGPRLGAAACTCSRWPTSRCCSARWSPMRIYRIPRP